MKTKNLYLMTTILVLFGVIKISAQSNAVYPNNQPGGTNCSSVSLGLAANPFTDPLATWNTFIGGNAGVTNTTGSNNTFIGTVSGNGNTTGGSNCALGVGSFQSSVGNFNIGIGTDSATGMVGDRNIYLGPTTGNAITGSGNVFLGGQIFGPTTLNNTTIIGDGVGTQRLYIDNLGRAGFGLGNFTVPGNRLEINSIWNTAGLAPGTAGLRFRGFTNSNFNTLTPAATPKVLSINGDGDVILVDDATGAGNDNDWHLIGNLATAPSIARVGTAGSHYVGTADNQDLVFRRNNVRAGLIHSTNTAFGNDALTAATLGTNNTAIGVSALKNNGSNYNVAVGYNSMLNNTGGNNAVLGSEAMSAMTSGSGNVSLGRVSGQRITTGSNNVIIGFGAGPTTAAAAGGVTSKLYIDTNYNFGAGNDTPLIYGEFNNQNLTFNVADNVNSRVLINSFGTNTNTTGLRFQDLTSAFVPDKNSNKFLTVDGSGDVVLRNIAPADPVCTIYNCDGQLTENRTVDMANNMMIFDTQESGRIYIGDTSLPTSSAFNIYNFATTSGDYRFYVEGGILTEKVKVALRSTADWADYVFANDYKLMPLKEVAAFVEENKHLPGIQSAEDLVKSGLDVAEMQAKQMGKIEELTLYVIKQDKEIEELKAQVKALLEKK